MSAAQPIETAPTDRRLLLFGDARLIGTPVDEADAEREWTIGRWRNVAGGELSPGFWETDGGEGWIAVPLFWADLPDVPAT